VVIVVNGGIGPPIEQQTDDWRMTCFCRYMEEEEVEMVVVLVVVVMVWSEEKEKEDEMLERHFVCSKIVSATKVRYTILPSLPHDHPRHHLDHHHHHHYTTTTAYLGK